jgi:ribonuclease BN (tRNA processing enzyme)
MEIKVLGAGSAFCLENYQSNFIINVDGKNLLLDCGGDIRFSLKEQGMSYKDIDAVYISHAHADHAGGLEYLAFCTMFDPSAKKPTLYCEKQLLSELWPNTLRGGLETIEGKLVSLDDYFNIVEVPQNSGFIFNDMEFNLVQTVHVASKYRIVPSYGLMFITPDLDVTKRIFWTSDTQFCPETYIKAAYNDSDLILHDCETSPFKSGVHSNFMDLVTLPLETKNKMLLYHYQDNVSLDFDTWNEKAKANGFRGFLRKGDILCGKNI